MDVRTSLIGKPHGRPSSTTSTGPEEQQALEEFRGAIWRYGFGGLFAGLCAGVLVAPFMKRFVGRHSNVATPLAIGSLFSMVGSAMAAQRHSHDITYAIFKRQETAKAFQDQDNEKRRLRQEAKDKRKAKAQNGAAVDDDNFW